MSAADVLVGIGAVGILGWAVGGGIKSSIFEVPLISTKKQGCLVLGISSLFLFMGLGIEFLPALRTRLVTSSDTTINLATERPNRAESSMAQTDGQTDRPTPSRLDRHRDTGTRRTPNLPSTSINVSSTNQSGGVTAGQIENVNQVVK